MTKVALFLTFAISLTVGCVGSPVHSTIKYNSVQAAIERNNEALLQMRIGMSQSETLEAMGKPERSEGYSWGSAWLYRTAMTSGIYGTADADFTPIVFGEKGIVIGWGRNFFVGHTKKFEVDVNIGKEK